MEKEFLKMRVKNTVVPKKKFEKRIFRLFSHLPSSEFKIAFTPGSQNLHNTHIGGGN